MRHTPEVNGASSPPLLYAGCASPLETGLFPVHARWCPRGSRKGALRDRVPPKARAAGRGPHPRDGRRARMPGRLDPSSAAVDLEVDEAAGKAAVPRAPDLGGERVRPPDSAPYLDPSFQNTAPPSQPAQHNEDTRFPLLFWTLYSPWTLLLYYFCLIKASPRPDATPTVSVVCSSRHNIYMKINYFRTQIKRCQKLSLCTFKNILKQISSLGPFLHFFYCCIFVLTHWLL